jgi:hypothetical protein
MAGTTSKNPAMPDITTLSAEQLAELVASANARLAEERERAVAEARRAAMEQVKAGLVNMSAVLKSAGEAIEAGDTAAVVQHMTDLVGLAQTARSTIAPQSVRSPRRAGTRNANGGARAEVLAFLRDHADTDHSPTQVANEIGRSSGHVGNELETLVEIGEAVRTQDAPKRYRAVTPKPADVPTE